MLMRIFRSCKTLICPSNSMLQEADHRILLNPIALCLLMNRLEFCDSQTSRLENRVRIGSKVILRSVTTEERLELRIVEQEKALPAKGFVSFTSVIGSALLGLRSSDVAQVNTPQGEVEWQVISVNNVDGNINT